MKKVICMAMAVASMTVVACGPKDQVKVDNDVDSTAVKDTTATVKSIVDSVENVCCDTMPQTKADASLITGSFRPNEKEIHCVTFNADTYLRVSPSSNAQIKKPYYGNNPFKFLKGKTYPSYNDTFIDMGNGWYKVILMEDLDVNKTATCYIPKENVSIRKYSVVRAPKAEFARNKNVFKDAGGGCLKFVQLNLNGYKLLQCDYGEFCSDGDILELTRMATTKISYMEYTSDYRESVYECKDYSSDVESGISTRYNISLTFDDPCYCAFLKKNDIDANGRLKNNITLHNTCVAAGEPATYSYYVPELKAVFDRAHVFGRESGFFYMP